MPGNAAGKGLAFFPRTAEVIELDREIERGLLVATGAARGAGLFGPAARMEGGRHLGLVIAGAETFRMIVSGMKCSQS